MAFLPGDGQLLPITGGHGILPQPQSGLVPRPDTLRGSGCTERALEEMSGITDSGAMTGYSVIPVEALSGVTPSSQSMKAQQKPHPMRHLVHHPKIESKRKGSLKSEKIVRQLLGELYVDKEYLEKLLLDEGFRHFVCDRELGAEEIWDGCLMHERETEPVV